MSRFRRRLMGLAALRQAAADDFVRVEYLENISNAYINSGIFGTMDLDFYIEFEPTELHQNSGKGLGSIFGSRTEWNQNIYQLTTFNKNATNKGHFIAAKNYGFTDKRVPTANMFLGGKNIIKKEGLIFTRADGTTFNLTSQSFTTPTRISIFGLTNVNGDVGENCKFKLYKLQFSKNGTLVRDYIPMYQISTDTYGLWDRVTEEFYTSPNGVKFTGGERVIADANDNIYYFRNYISTYNTQRYLNTGIYANSTDYWETKVYLASGRNYAFGGWGANNSNMYGVHANANTISFVYGSGGINYSVKYANKIFTLKQMFDDKTQTMHFYAYDANGTQVFHNSIAKRGSAASKTFYIGNYNGSTYGSTNGTRFYNFKYYRNGELIREYIPVQSCEDGVYGFFDKVNLRFYKSNGTQPFTGA